MPQDYIVQDNDTLTKIAKQFQFRDGGDAIWNANPDLQKKTNGNRDVLLVGWKILIPDKKDKDDSRSTSRRHPFQVPVVKKNLGITLLDSEGNPVQGQWQYRFVQEGQDPQKGVASNGQIVLKEIDEDTPQATLELYEPQLFDQWKLPLERIALEIGGLDPISSGDEGMAAIQKILTNLGYYEGSIDGNAGPQTCAAVVGFQQDYLPKAVNGKIDQAFCSKLKEVQGFPIGIDRSSETDCHPPGTYIDPLSQGSAAPSKHPDNFKSFVTYEEPAANDPTGQGKPCDQLLKQMGMFRFFPDRAYVAPCAPGEEGQKSNRIRMPERKFIFLDTGNFYSNHTTFGVIWGWHVYLCNYTGGHDPVDAAAPSGDRLDDLLFSALGGASNVQVTTHASASWAPSTDFDWDKIYLIVPDMHLMTKETAKTWHGHTTWKFWEHYEYDFDVERKFRAFAQTLATNAQSDTFQKLQSGLKVIQLGDSYDLWIHCEPLLYQENKTRQFVLKTDQSLTDPQGQPETPVQRLARWVQEIQTNCPDGDSINPAEQGLRVLSNAFGGIDYIYGNHDNYLILEEVCGAAGIDQRKRWLEYDGIYIEHAHRMEAKFTDTSTGKIVEGVGIGTAIAGAGVAVAGALLGSPALIGVGVGILALGAATALLGNAIDAYNYDGNPSGFKLANLLYGAMDTWLPNALGLWFKDKADNQARNHDQPQYISEFARVWLGRQAGAGDFQPPHIMVIGHTHIPNLFEINIEPWKIG